MKQVERYFYPAVFSYAPDQEIAVTFPDLDVATSGTDDTDALLIAATYIGDGNGTIYRGYGTNPLDAAYTFKNGRIYKGDGRFTLSLDALYTIRDGSNNTWPYDAAYSIEGERIYRGNATFASWFDVLFTVRDGQFYKGDSSFILDIAYTVRDGRVYEGRGEFANTLFDVLYTIEYGGY